MTSFVR